MNATDRLSIVALPAWYPLGEYRRRLVLDGKPTSVVVHGDAISKQYVCGNGFVLITQYDYFDGVSHWFYRLDPSARVLDQASTPDYFGFIQKISVEGPTEISFGFFGTNDQWRLSVKEAGFWSFGRAALARRFNRFFFCKRYLSMQRARPPREARI